MQSSVLDLLTKVKFPSKYPKGDVKRAARVWQSSPGKT